MSTPAGSQSSPSTVPGSFGPADPEFATIGNSHFSIPSLAALYTSTFAQGFSNDECQAAARALLRHKVHQDGAHYQTRTIGGLHPSYVNFNPASRSKKMLSNKALAEASLEDVFDAITMQDRLDGGISLLVRCAGVEAAPVITPDQITVDLYMTPHELHETRERISGDLAVLVQAFCQEFAIPHLHHFNRRCELEIINPPENPEPATPVSAQGPQHIPLPMAITGSRIQCSAAAASSFDPMPASTVTSTPSAAIRKAKSMSTKPPLLTTPATPNKSQTIRQRRMAEMFVSNRATEKTTTSSEPFDIPPSVVLTDTTIFGPPLISIGPNTDAIFDRFKMGDEILPRLRTLIATVCSSRWEAVLRSQQWDLTYEQASNLARALAADVQGGVVIRVEKVRVFVFQILLTN
ncbi:hypothetical protein HYDPIDRAFT_34206 [Hydnomerulius pinastri MD-312]|uniref:Uncharacterized protein n=1 Tax=Hydnomerulius pinastri MD-312 TaxID=994086 RepID=A0A0C9VLD9_9AGAM|nr:hypothetical protein HYDPIDRAFT_34206 [Hydnomerulius pinastri MD-312]